MPPALSSVTAQARRHPWLAAMWVALCAAALLQLGRASVFAWDATRAEYSASPATPFRVEHSCLTAYAEAARFAAQGGVDIYDANLYRPGGIARHLGPLRVDPYHYPPPFLLLPAAVRAVAPGFFQTRVLWFALPCSRPHTASRRGSVAAWARGARSRRPRSGRCPRRTSLCKPEITRRPRSPWRWRASC